MEYVYVVEFIYDGFYSFNSVFGGFLDAVDYCYTNSSAVRYETHTEDTEYLYAYVFPEKGDAVALITKAKVQ